MKNFKKVLAFTLAFALMLSSMNMAFAEETMKSEAQKLNDLGLLAGVADTELGAEVTRAVGLTMVLKAIGYTQEDANAKAADNPYIDIKYDWVKGFAALGTELGITDGVGEKKFGPMQKMDEKQLVTFMLRALGYNAAETWAKAGEWGVEAGLIADADFAKVKFTKDAAAKIMFNALKADLKGEGQKGRLIDKLIKDGATTREKAVDAGLMAASSKPVISEVKANNLRQVMVMFANEVEKKSAETIGNYRVKGKNVKSASLKEDGKTVVLTIGADTKSSVLANKKETKLTVTGVKGLKSEVMDKAEVLFTPFDEETPKVEKITFTGPKSFSIKFSEPVSKENSTDNNEKPSVEVRAGSTRLSTKIEFSTSDETVANVKLYSKLKDGTEYRITVEDFEDFASYDNILHQEVLMYNENKEVPVAEVVSASETIVEVKFDKPVTGLTKKHFYHTYSGWTAKQIYKSSDMSDETIVKSSDEVSKVWVKFANNTNDHPLRPGSVEFTIKAKADNKEVKDAWGNKYPGETFNLTIVSDREAPTVVSVEVKSGKELKVTFNESISNIAGAKYKLLDDKGKNLNLYITASGSDGEKVATLKLNKDQAGKVRTLVIEGIKDSTLYKNEMAQYTEEINFGDSDFEGVERVELKRKNNNEPGALFVVFKEELDESAIDLANYKVKTAGGEVFNLDGPIDFYEGSKVVRIELSGEEAAKVQVNDKLLMANLKDLAGNKMNAFQAEATIKMIGTVKAKIKSAKVTDVRTLEVQYDQTFTSVYKDNFTIKTYGTSDYVAMDKNKYELDIEENSTGTKLIFRINDSAKALPYDVEETDSNVKISYATIENGSNTVNVFNVSPEVQTDIVAKDNVAPAVKKFDKEDSTDNFFGTLTPDDKAKYDDKQEIEAVFTSATSSTTPAKYEIHMIYTEGINDESLDKTTYKLNNGIKVSSATVAGSGNRQVTLTLEVDDDSILEDIKVTQVEPIEDKLGNVLQPDSEAMTVNKYADALKAPRFVSATGNDKETVIKVKFSEPVYANWDSANKVATGDLEIADFTATGKTISNVRKVSATEYELTLNASLEAGTAVEIVAASDAIYDGEGNVTPNTTKIYCKPTNVAPKVASIVWTDGVGGSSDAKMVVTFDEDISVTAAAGNSSPYGITVKAGTGSTKTIKGVVISGTTVVITFDQKEAFVEETDIVVIPEDTVKDTATASLSNSALELVAKQTN